MTSPPNGDGRRATVSALRKWSPRALGLVLIAWAAVVLWRELHAIDPQEVAARMRAWGAWRVGLAIGLAATSFGLTAIVEWLGLRWSGAPLPFPAAALRSLMVNGLIHSLGANVVVATLARSWIYRRTGQRLAASATTTAFAAISLICGLGILVGLGLLAANPSQLNAIRMSMAPARGLGALLLALVAGYVGACAAWPRARLFADIRLPRAGEALAQAGIGAVDNGISAALLWLLIGQGGPAYPAFVVAYALAYLAGLFSNLPGGAGVFEAALMLLLPDAARPSLAAGFLGFRLVFYLLPLVLALLLIGLEFARPGGPRSAVGGREPTG